MLGKKLVSALESYVSLNKKQIVKKLAYFEDFRLREDLLRDYSSKLSDFDKIQIEASLSDFNSQFSKIKKDLEDFNPMDINSELVKVLKYGEFLTQVKEEYNEISLSMAAIEKSWTTFLKRNSLVKDTFFEEEFITLFHKTWEIIHSSSALEMNRVDFAISNLQKEMNKIIAAIEKVNIYLNLYVYVGEEALLLKSKIKGLMNISRFESRNEYFKTLEKVFNEVYSLEENSLCGTAGLEIVKVSSGSGIVNYTLEFSGELLDYDPFFNNNNLDIERTGKYIYFENFPTNGIFKGRDIVENFNLSSDYYDSLVKIKSTMDKNFKIGLSVLLSFSGLSLLMLNTYLNLFNFGALIMFLIIQPALLDMTISKYERIYHLKSIFLFTRIDFGYTSFGHHLDIRLLIQRMLEKFNSTILNEENLKEGKIIWTKKYQLVKRP